MVASGAGCAVGMATPKGGDMRIRVDSIAAAQTGSMFLYRNWGVVTTGNPLVHALLQGSVNACGKRILTILMID